MLQNVFFPKENCVKIAQKLVAEMQVKVSPSTLEKDLTDHPDYPSLLSISDVLNNYSIENVSFKTDIPKPENIPVPFVAVIKDKGSRHNLFTVVNSVTNDTVTYYDTKADAWKSVDKTTFNSIWPSGIVLMADAEESTAEKDYEKKIREEKRHRATTYATFFSLPVLAFVAAIAAIVQYGTIALYPVLFTLITLAGCIISSLLIWYELDEYNPVLQQICTAGKKINCGAILNSNASKIWGISWSVIGFSYFAGGLLLMLCYNMLVQQSQFLVAWFNVLAVPYVFFSIYYQWRIAKQWCVLCLSVQALLVLQLTISLLAGWHTAAIINSAFVNAALIPVAIAYLIPFITLSLLLPTYRVAKESKRNKAELQRLKHNPQIFEALLAKQKAITESTEGMGINLGNPNGAIKLVKVCSPYCNPCAEAHSIIDELIENNSNIQVQILFTATNSEKDQRALPVKHLLAIAQKMNPEETAQALDDWYLSKHKDYNLFAEKYPINRKLSSLNEELNNMSRWCGKMDIRHTPTFFVNGYQLPDNYRVTDLKYFFSV